MRLLYLSSATLPSTLANSQYVMWMCEGFAQTAQVTLCTMQVLKAAREVYDFYGVRPSFDIRQAGTAWRPRSFWLGLRYALFIAKYRPDLVYLCEAKLLKFLQFFAPGGTYVYDTENPPSELKNYVRNLNATRGIICYNELLKRALVEVGIRPEKILIAPSGVNLEHYLGRSSQEALRLELGLPVSKRIVMYTGHFYAWKGVDTLVRASKLLDSDTEIYLIGGKEEHTREIRHVVSSIGAVNVQFVPFQPPERVPKFLQAADVLVLPNATGSENSMFYTSPLKLFQYMAAGRPIVASDLPSIRQILGPDNAFMVKPDDPGALAQGICQALSGAAEAARRAKLAREQVREYTWEKRAERILKFATDLQH